jgi:hypothetical protein
LGSSCDIETIGWILILGGGKSNSYARLPIFRLIDGEWAGSLIAQLSLGMTEGFVAMMEAQEDLIAGFEFNCLVFRIISLLSGEVGKGHGFVGHFAILLSQLSEVLGCELIEKIESVVV